ncbi:MAG: hypothetical protein ACLGQH_02750 [Acidobacteriota bacterium]
MIRFIASPEAKTAAVLRQQYAALRRRRSHLEQLLDAGEMAAARTAAARFAAEARTLRQALASHHPETAPPPAALDLADSLDTDDRTLRLNLPDRLHGVMAWLAGRQRQALAGLGEGRRRALRLLGATLCLGLVLALAAGGRELWRWRQQALFREARATFAVDLLRDDSALPPDFQLAGLRGLERQDGLVWRWGIGPRTLLAFTLPLPRTVRLSFRVNNPVPGQVLTVTANDMVTVIPLPRVHRWLEPGDAFAVTFPGRVGLNAIAIDYKAYNQFTMAFAPGDPTGYAAAFTAFTFATERP